MDQNGCVVNVVSIFVLVTGWRRVRSCANASSHPLYSTDWCFKSRQSDSKVEYITCTDKFPSQCLLWYIYFFKNQGLGALSCSMCSDDALSRVRMLWGQWWSWAAFPILRPERRVTHYRCQEMRARMWTWANPGLMCRRYGESNDRLARGRVMAKHRRGVFCKC